MLNCTICTNRPLFAADAKAFEAKELSLLDPSYEYDAFLDLDQRFYYTIEPKVYWSTGTILKRIRDILGKDLVYIDWIEADKSELFVDCYIENKKELKEGLKRLRQILGGGNFIVCTETYCAYKENYEPDMPKGLVARILLLGLLDREYESIRGAVLEYAALQAFGQNYIVGTHTHTN